MSIAALASIVTIFIAPGVSITISFMSILISTGISCWHQAASQKDSMRFLAIFAFPYFCWFPIVVVFSTLFMLRYLTWQYTTLIWVIVLGTCAALWIYGQNKERKASNPLKGILDVAK